MKAVLTVPTRAYVKPYPVFHRIIEKIQSKEVKQAAEKLLTICLCVIVVAAAASLFNSISAHLQGWEMLTHLSNTMTKGVWMPF